MFEGRSSFRQIFLDSCFIPGATVSDAVSVSVFTHLEQFHWVLNTWDPPLEDTDLGQFFLLSIFFTIYSKK